MNTEWKIGLAVGTMAGAMAACSTASQGAAGTEGTGSSGTSGAASSAAADGGPGGGPDAGTSAGMDASATDTGPAADTAMDTAGGSTGGGADDTNCCLAHESPSCNEPAVAECVCAVDANCCVFGWDEVCATAAEQDCKSQCISDPGQTGSSDGVDNACQELLVLDYNAVDATLDGGWIEFMSMQEAMLVAAWDGGAPEGAITFAVDVPCDDTWHIWVRWFEGNAADDSFFAAVDGAPSPMAIFEGDCSGDFQGMGWTWSEMNWRDPDAAPCNYVEDPWTFDWTSGTHEVVYGYREAIAMARIVVTNDPDYAP